MFTLVLKYKKKIFFHY